MKELECHIAYTTSNGKKIDVAEKIDLISTPYLEPCLTTNVNAMFELPILTRDDIIICLDKHMDTNWDIRPWWKFSIADTGQQFDAPKNPITINFIPYV